MALLITTFFFKDYIYLWERESMSGEWGGVEAEGEGKGEADSPLSWKPDMVLNPRTLGSRPEPRCRGLTGWATHAPLTSFLMTLSCISLIPTSPPHFIWDCQKTFQLIESLSLPVDKFWNQACLPSQFSHPPPLSPPSLVSSQSTRTWCFVEPPLATISSCPLPVLLPCLDLQRAPGVYFCFISFCGSMTRRNLFTKGCWEKYFGMAT